MKARWFSDECGQATVEFVVVATALAVVVCGLGALARSIEHGSLTERATTTLSHSIGQTGVGAVADVLLY